MRILYLFFALLSIVFVKGSEKTSEENESQSLLWGTYRPNLYFGMRPRLPKSLMTGLMWYGVQHLTAFTSLRHSCEQGDNLRGYTWTEHDPRDGGVEVVRDELNNLDLRVEWLKTHEGKHGGSWSVRISGKPLDTSRPSLNSLIFYAGLEGFGGLEMDQRQLSQVPEGPLALTGRTPELGEFKMKFENGPESRYVTRGRRWEDFVAVSSRTHVAGMVVADGTIWQAEDLVSRALMAHAEPLVTKYGGKEAPDELPDAAFLLMLDDHIARGSNFYAIQKIFDGPFSFDVHYETADSKQTFDRKTFTTSLAAFKESFDTRFKDVFPIPKDATPGLFEFSKAITSNLLGGIGYFYGTSIVDRSVIHEWDEEDSVDTTKPSGGGPELAGPTQLLTATPSRSFFPRGFYWDEGFHLLHIGEWDNDLSLEILRDWMKLVDEDGWVGREQILGEEARSKVPKEFQTQYPTYANPPTLAMAVTAFIQRLKQIDDPADMETLGLGGAQLPLIQRPEAEHGNALLRDPEAARAYLHSIYPTLRRHYLWFRRTQKGQIKQWGRKASSRTEAYRWRGRTPDHVLTSGLDDYPRARPPHVGELHLDLISWMGFFSRTMKQIAGYIGQDEDEAEYAAIEEAIITNIDDLHWNKEEKMYCDASVNEEDDSYHVCHRGYISLFPLLLGLLPPDSPHLGSVLELMHDRQHLWSPYGIRSLSASHPLFGKDEDYWRGAIWMQMNYMALASLKNIYTQQPGPYQKLAHQIYSDLRHNIIKNTHKEFERTGYVWEQYDASTGEGRRSHPFTGWTSLVTLIISEKYPGF
ncbi:glycoside hydrolase [Dacryopinax primogenitus]|uniref:Mannosyl-oligosaccharide glucosidase n=1 Tax=Dacryopinax primogenitus (strain DJM 731) TaxID=1858805 RepID=M5G9V3_DACPD|nr:glycoside hydrolase [Dacryopinax primogenitus]EJU05594.1 glycoside hydrolase [Dacryopinax primogenitus]